MDLIKLSGEISEIDKDNRSFTLVDRQGKEIAIVYWSKKHETDTKILKQKPGFYEEPIVTLSDGSVRIPRYNLFDLPWAKRPEDFPKRERVSNDQERMIVAEVLYKALADLWMQTNTPDVITFEQARREILQAVKEDLPKLLAIGRGRA